MNGIAKNIGYCRRSARKVAGSVAGILLVIGLISCGNPVGQSLRKASGALGTLTIKIPSIASWIGVARSSAAKSLGSKALGYATSASAEVLGPDNVVVAGPVTSGFAGQPGAENVSLSIPTVPVGTDYTVSLAIYNSAVSATSPTATGMAQGVSVAPGVSTSVTVTCLPSNPTPIASLPGTLTDAISAFGEKWYSLQVTKGSTYDFTETATDFAFALFDSKGMPVGNSGAFGAPAAYGATYDGTLFIGVANAGTASAADNLTVSVAAEYTVAYDGNGNTGGDVPIDSTPYNQGQTVTVLGDPGSLTKAENNFVGWNTKADGTGIAYSQGQTFPMGGANTTLYAKWSSSPSVVMFGTVQATSTSQVVAGYWKNNVWTALQTPAGSSAPVNGQLFNWSESEGNVYLMSYQGINNPGSAAFGYWTNGDWTPLEAISGDTVNNAWGLATYDGVAHVLGCLNNDPNLWAGYWENGVWNWLTQPAGASWIEQTSEMTIVAGTVYVDGAITKDRGTTYIPGYWTGDVWTPLAVPTGYTYKANQNINQFSGILISGSTVYNIGSLSDANGNIVYGYWVGTSWTPFELPAEATVSSVHSEQALLIGSTVYQRGTLTVGSISVEGFWAGSAWTSISSETVPAGNSISSVDWYKIAVSGASACVGGQITNGTTYTPGYWLDGNWTSLPPAPAYANGGTNDVAISGNSVYVSGGSGNSQSDFIPGYWLNGTWIAEPLPSGYSMGWGDVIIVH